MGARALEVVPRDNAETGEHNVGAGSVRERLGDETEAQEAGAHNSDATAVSEGEDGETEHDEVTNANRRAQDGLRRYNDAARGEQAGARATGCAGYPS